MPRVIATAGLCLVLTCSGVAAQQAAQAQPQPQPQPKKEEAPVVDVTKLPVAPDRLHRKVRESIEREELVGNTLRYTVDVFAFAPRLTFFTPQDNLLYGPARSQVPTVQDMINLSTPKEFSSPVMDLGNFGRWLGDKSKDKK